MVTLHPTEMIHVTKNENWETGLFKCCNMKWKEQFEVVSGVLNQHQRVKLCKSKDAVVNVKKLRVVNPAQSRRYQPLIPDL